MLCLLVMFAMLASLCVNHELAISTNFEWDGYGRNGPLQRHESTQVFRNAIHMAI